MITEKRKFGDIGEDIAKNYLISKGYEILDQNYRIKNIGEIDIVARINREIVFFEVKTRDVKHETFFPPETSINEKKRRNLKKICQLYIMDKYRNNQVNWKVDAILISVDYRSGEYKIGHVENILWEEYY